jgi:hypothetical protein
MGFFNFAWDGKNKFLYADWKTRKHILDDNKKNHPFEKCKIDADCFDFIMEHFKIPIKKHTNWSSYTYNPVTKEFSVDRKVEGHDIELAKEWACNIDFKNIIPSLNIKKIINPFKVEHHDLTKYDLTLIKNWCFEINPSGEDSYDSSWNGICEFIETNVGISVCDSIWYTINDLHVKEYIKGNGAETIEHACDTPIAIAMYVSSFFNLKYKFDFSPIVKLWERGFVVCDDNRRNDEMFEIKYGNYADKIFKISKLVLKNMII